MSAYGNDLRVKQVSSEIYAVTRPSDVIGTDTLLVWPNQEDGGWATDDKPLTTFGTADEAIRSLIGDPQ